MKIDIFFIIKMVIIMKKYLFLLFLFIIYLALQFNNKTEYSFSEVNGSNSNVIETELIFDNGINSKELNNLFNSYDGQFYIKEIYTLDNTYEVSCENYNECINQIFSFNDTSFNSKYITTGFSIKKIILLAYNDEIIPFLSNNGIVYKINS